MRAAFGAIAEDIAKGLVLRHDHGTSAWPMTGEIAFLGIASSPAFVRAPEGNGCAERALNDLLAGLIAWPTEKSSARANVAMYEGVTPQDCCYTDPV